MSNLGVKAKKYFVSDTWVKIGSKKLNSKKSDSCPGILETGDKFSCM
jgi:hypothetical protein